MELPLLARGMVVGFGIAAPVGPIGLLVIQRTLTGGRMVGLASGLGAATADAFYGLVAALGLTLVAGALTSLSTALGIVGGLFLLWLGISTAFKAPTEHAAPSASRGGLAGAWFSTLLLTLTNPMTVLAFAAILSGAGLLREEGSPASGIVLVLGVFLGSALWWLLLSGTVGLLRHKVTTGALVWVNRAAGLLLVGFGLVALYSVLRT